MHRRRAALLGAAAAALAVAGGFGVVAKRRARAAEPPAASAPAPALPSAREPAWTTLASCDGVRRAPLPEPHVGGVAVEASCPVLEDVRRSFALPQDPDANALQLLRASVEKAVTANPVACARALANELAGATRCGLVYDAVAIRVVNGNGVPAPLVAAELERPAACRWKLLSALREAKRAEPTVVATLLRMTRDPDTDIRNAAWMTLGTLTFIARGAGEDDVVACLEGTLATELEASDDVRLPILVGAAGNAGCVSCRGTLERHLASKDARLRRAAIAAYRFLDTPGDVETMCRVARADADESVRGSATYALRHAKSAMPRRLECLYAVATEDAAERVALDAVSSLSELAEASDLVVGTLVEVARETPHPKVRNEAIAVLRGHASDDAIKDALTAPRDD